MRKTIFSPLALISLAMLFYVPAAAAQSSAATTPSPSSAPRAQATAQPAAQSAGPFKDLKERFSYALGVSIGGNLKRQSVDVDLNVLQQGLKDGLEGGKPLLTDEQMKAAYGEMQAQVHARQQAEAGNNLKVGQDFLDANKTKPGVVALPSGLQYKVLVAGTGPKPRATDTVVCNYRGTLISGSEFDSSYKRGEPATFAVNRVIPGWTEALQLMPVGSKWQLFVPASLAYGERTPDPSAIPPNSVLIFEVELISIQGQH